MGKLSAYCCTISIFCSFLLSTSMISHPRQISNCQIFPSTPKLQYANNMQYPHNPMNHFRYYHSDSTCHTITAIIKLATHSHVFYRHHIKLSFSSVTSTVDVRNTGPLNATSIYNHKYKRTRLSNYIHKLNNQWFTLMHMPLCSDGYNVFYHP